jgi:hypothetical protein
LTIQAPKSAPEAADAALAAPLLAKAPSSRAAWGRVALLFFAGLVVCTGAYLALTVPRAWFPAATPKAWAADNLALARGAGAIADNELVITAPDSTGTTIVSVVVKFRSFEYSAIAWVAKNIPGEADVRLIWQNDYSPETIFSTRVRIEAGRTLPAMVTNERGWIGNITGLALLIQGPLPQPARIRGVVAKPMGAFEILGDRVREWLAFESWTGTSINTVTGGPDLQDLPLPLLLACTVALAVAIAWLLRYYRPRWFPLPLPMVLAALFVAASLVLDGRWTWNLARQLAATRAQYAGLDSRGKYLASEDGPLYAFVEKARKVLPESPARVFVFADTHYFRGRAAYHLYPHNVYFDPVMNTVPPPGALHSGDWIVVFQRRGIQYNAAEQRLRWDGGQTVAAELKLVDPLGAVFLIK